MYWHLVVETVVAHATPVCGVSWPHFLLLKLLVVHLWTYLTTLLNNCLWDFKQLHKKSKNSRCSNGVIFEFKMYLGIRSWKGSLLSFWSQTTDGLSNLTHAFHVAKFHSGCCRSGLWVRSQVSSLFVKQGQVHYNTLVLSWQSLAASLNL